MPEAVNLSCKTPQLLQFHTLGTSVFIGEGEAQIYLLIFLGILNFIESTLICKLLSRACVDFPLLPIGQVALLSHHTQKWKSKLWTSFKFLTQVLMITPNSHSLQASGLKMKAFPLRVPLGSISSPVTQSIQNQGPSYPTESGGAGPFRRQWLYHPHPKAKNREEAKWGLLPARWLGENGRSF